MKLREDIIKPLIKNKAVLDLGNSWGDFKELIQANCKKYYGLDLEKGSDYKADLNKPVNIKKKFDVIIAGELIEHIENTGIFLENVNRHLKPDGIFFLTTPNPTSFRFFIYGLIGKEPSFGGHVKYFTLNALTLILGRHFKIKKIGFDHYTTNTPNKHKLSWKIKFFFECLVGDIIPRSSPDIYAVCKLK